MATVTYKCPNCGGGLQFEPSSQHYKCEYCLSKFAQEQLDAIAPETASDQKAQTEMPEGQVESVKPDVRSTAALPMVYTCPSCGAEVITDETTAATFCYYCHNPVVLSGKLDGAYAPDYVVPFKIDKDQANKMFLDWIKKKKYVPKAFFSKEQIEKMTGVYFPYWLYSCQVTAKIDGEATKLRNWTTGNVEYVERKQYEVKRDGNMQVEHVTRNALKKANRKLVEGVLPFEMKELKPFSMGYLSGFQAEKRDMEKQNFEVEVEQEVKQFATDNLRNSVAEYSGLQISDEATVLQDPSWKYALMPVWTLTYRDQAKDKIYYFSMNGQSGKICGELPVDPTRLAILFASIFVPVMTVLLIVGYLI